MYCGIAHRIIASYRASFSEYPGVHRGSCVLHISVIERETTLPFGSGVWRSGVWWSGSDGFFKQLRRGVKATSQGA